MRVNSCDYFKHQFTDYKLIIKDKRFYIADQDNYPIGIFEYRDGTKELKVKDSEDGIPVFLYKAILSKKLLKMINKKSFR